MWFVFFAALLIKCIHACESCSVFSILENCNSRADWVPQALNHSLWEKRIICSKQQNAPARGFVLIPVVVWCNSRFDLRMCVHMRRVFKCACDRVWSSWGNPVIARTLKSTYFLFFLGVRPCNRVEEYTSVWVCEQDCSNIHICWGSLVKIWFKKNQSNGWGCCMQVALA